MKSACQFVLASASPRRIAFLQEAAYVFEVRPSHVEEIPSAKESGLAYAVRIAKAKAWAAHQLQTTLPALGADTDVVLNDRILGKPADNTEAAEMLQSLSGQKHQVISAVALVLPDSRIAQINTITEVEFAKLSALDIAHYLASNEALDKAGAYGIQSKAACFVKAIHGSYTGVVGLPLAETFALLAQYGITPQRNAVD